MRYLFQFPNGFVKPMSVLYGIHVAHILMAHMKYDILVTQRIRQPDFDGVGEPTLVHEIRNASP